MWQTMSYSHAGDVVAVALSPSELRQFSADESGRSCALERYGLIMDRSERIAIFDSDDLLVPKCVCQLMSIPDIERVVGAYHRARSHLEVHDVGTSCAQSFLESASGGCTVGHKPAQYPPANKFDHRRDLDVFSTIEDIAWSHAVEEDVPCERLRVGHWGVH